MTLTLKDLVVPTDVSTPAPRAAATHAHASSDPFAAFFNHADAHDAPPKTASHDSQAASSSSQSSASTAKDSHANRADDSRNHDGNDRAAHVHRKSDTAASASTPNAASADQRKPTSDADATSSGNPSPTTATNDASDAPINLFQVTLLAAQAGANDPTNGSTATAPQTSAIPAVGSVTADSALASDTTASALPMPTADIAALLAGQDNAIALLASTTVPTDPNIQANNPPTQTPAVPSTPTTGDIAILSMAAAPTEQAANVAAPTPPRPTDGRGMPTTTQTSGGSSTRTSGDDSSQTDAKADAASSMSVPGDSAATPIDPTAVPFVPTGADNMSPSHDDASSQPDNAVNTAVSSNAVTTGIATPQQAQALYTKTASRTDSLPQVTIDQVAMRLTKAADDGLDHLTIHLKPAELGSIEVKLEMGDNGISKTTISADRPDTLNLLQRDSHRLEQALENAGLKTDPGSLSFNLRGDGGRYGPNFSQGNGSSYSPYARNTADDALPPVNPAILGYINSRAALGGIDIRV